MIFASPLRKPGVFKALSNGLFALFSIGCCTALVADEAGTLAQENGINLGRKLSDSQLQALPQHVFSDGAGLPDGSGSAVQGSLLYSAHCASCHGNAGQGGKALELVGDRSLLVSDYPDRGIGVYWPYAPTLFEYINRSMPPQTPGMFTSDELYSLIAYVLYLNGLVEETAVLNRGVLSELKLPNRDGFTTIGH